MVATRPDPVAGSRAADPAIDVRLAPTIDPRAYGAGARALVVRGNRARTRGNAGRHRRPRSPRMEHERRMRRALGPCDARRWDGMAARARIGAAVARRRIRHRARDAAAVMARAAAKPPPDPGCAGRTRRCRPRTTPALTSAWDTR